MEQKSTTTRWKCQHGKTNCKICHPHRFCYHMNPDKLGQKIHCSTCSPNQFCNHVNPDKLGYKSNCSTCSPQNFCNHVNPDKLGRKSVCSTCNPKAFCNHMNPDKLGYKSNCSICSPKAFCIHCKFIRKMPKKDYCFKCFCILFPDAPVTRRYMLKEHHLRDALKKKYPETKMTFNQSLGACSKRRPDVFIELITHTIVIECDEHSHKNTTCETKRMCELFQDTNHRPIVFLRFNPDLYKGNTCFFIKEQGLGINRKEWNNRLKALASRINYFKENQPNQEMTIEYLFYE
jgi:hypothetical protein